MQFVSFTYPGLESVLKKEILQRKFQLVKVEDSLVVFEGDESTLIKANLWLRTANKVYILLKEAEVLDFEKLFSEIYQINWTKYIPSNFRVNINVKTHKSQLSATSSIQSIVQKAIYKKLAPHGEYKYGDKHIEVRIDIFKNKAKILLDTSWEPLYKRGYKVGIAQAGLKETLAAWIILLAGCKQNTCYDPFCGWWTLLIEKAMIDLNIAPWLWRKFVFEDFGWIDKNLIEKERWRASTRKKDKMLNLIGFDIDPKMVQLANQNIKNAGLEKYIKVTQKDYLNVKIEKCLLTNPPYDKRIKLTNLKIYDKLFEDLRWVECGWIITGYDVSNKFYDAFKVRVLSNWGKKVKFFYKS